MEARHSGFPRLLCSPAADRRQLGTTVLYTHELNASMAVARKPQPAWICM